MIDLLIDVVPILCAAYTIYLMKTFKQDERLANRPYVSINESSDIRYVPQKGIEINCQIENTGKHPCENLQIKQHVVVRKDGLYTMHEVVDKDIVNALPPRGIANYTYNVVSAAPGIAIFIKFYFVYEYKVMGKKLDNEIYLKMPFTEKAKVGDKNLEFSNAISHVIVEEKYEIDKLIKS